MTSLEQQPNTLPSITIQTKIFRIQDRISINSNSATIKYIGLIPQWPNQKALGIEWDDLTKGKNNGCLNSVRYFHTLNDSNSGSFIKLTDRKLRSFDLSRSFFDALIYQYGGIADSGDDCSSESSGGGNDLLDKFQLDLGSKVLESYGFEKFASFQSNFNNLTVVSLNHLGILNEIGIAHNELAQMLTNLEVLDIGFNLFNDWNFILRLINCLPRVNCIRLNGNRFNDSISVGTIQGTKNIKKVALASCGLSFHKDEFLKSVLNSFPSIQDIHLAANYFDNSNIRKLNPLGELNNLRNLDLSCNKLTEIDFAFLNSLSCLEVINLSDNEIRISQIPDESHAINSKITDIDLSGNEITNWSEIDNLSAIFPNLQSLKITLNPILEGSNNNEEYDYTMMQLISRLPNSNKINGTEYTEEQIKAYELYFISKVSARELDYNQRSGNWLRLCKKYNIQRTISCQDSKSTNQNYEIILKVIYKDRQVFEQMIFPNSYTVGKLKGYISRKLGLNILDFQVYFSIDGTRNKLERLQNNQEVVGRFNLQDGDRVYIEEVTLAE